MNNLFGKKLVSSISFSQDDLLQSIVHLHLKGNRFDIDATYGYGDFYKKIPEPMVKSDIEPKVTGVTVGDCRRIPFDDAQFDSAMFDPPFILTEHKESKLTTVAAKYGYFKKIADLRMMYRDAIQEHYRILKPGGVLVMKCQDMAHAGQNHFVHVEVINMAEEIGFKTADLFILFAKNRFSANIKRERVARKFHCYFIVFRKRIRKSRKNEHKG